MLLDELLVALHRINAHTEDMRLLLDGTPAIAQGAGLLGAARRVVLRIKVEHDRAALESSEADGFTA